MKKVFASDFDGTLYFYKASDERKLPPENVEKVKQYQEAGHLFGLCTGRQVGGLTPFIGGIIRPDFYITSRSQTISSLTSFPCPAVHIYFWIRFSNSFCKLNEELTPFF